MKLSAAVVWMVLLYVASIFIADRAVDRATLDAAVGETESCRAVQWLRPFARVWRTSLNCPADALTALAIDDAQPLYARRHLPHGAIVGPGDLIAAQQARLLARSLRSLERPVPCDVAAAIDAGDHVEIVATAAPGAWRASVLAVLECTPILELTDPDRTAVLAVADVTVRRLSSRSNP